MPAAEIKGRALRSVRPELPQEISDGKEALFWAVFVDEPPGGEAASLDESAKRADTAWLFKISTIEEK